MQQQQTTTKQTNKYAKQEDDTTITKKRLTHAVLTQDNQRPNITIRKIQQKYANERTNKHLTKTITYTNNHTQS